MEAFTFNTAELILLSAAGILFIIQLIYYFGLYNRIHVRNKTVRKEETHFSRELPPLSVILCARNEADNLRKILPAILEQDYPQFEVIVINDASTDETEDVLGYMEEKYPHLYHSFTPDSARYISHKKLALTLGIKASKHDWLVFTETNCMPASNQWLKLMARNFTSQTQIVLGYSGYDRIKGWLHKRIAFDTLFQSLRYLGFALAGNPYMGIGRNMAYRKELFFKNKGFSKFLHLHYGDDDLFINEIANRTNTRVEISEAGQMTATYQDNYEAWKELKLQYDFTSKYLHTTAKSIFGIAKFFDYAFDILFVCLWVEGIIHNWTTAVLASILALSLFSIKVIVYRRAAKILRKPRLFFSLPFFSFIQPCINLYFKVIGSVTRKKNFTWR